MYERYSVTGGGGRPVTAVRDTLAEWSARPPASHEAAIGELLAYAARDVTSGR